MKVAEAAGALKRGDLARAATLLEDVLGRDRNDADALHMLASVAVARGLPEHAAEMFERLARIRPRDVAASINLARVRLGMGDAQGAILAADRALRIQRDVPSALATKADALNRLGRADEAASLLEPVVQRGEENAEIGHSYAVLLAQAGRHEEAIALARRHFESSAMPDPLLRRMLGFALGQSLDALGRYEEAFQAFSGANAVAAAGAPFNPQELIAGVDGLIAFYTPSRCRSLVRSTQSSRMPVLVTGVARSGTTLVEQIIHAHPLGHGAGELPDLDVIAAEAPQRLASARLYPDCLAELNSTSADGWAAEYLARLRRAAPHAQRVVDKNLRSVMHLGLVWQILPGANVVHCRRDPLANGLSCFLSALSPRLHPWASDLRHIGLMIRQVERLFSHWKSVLELHVLQVQYEGVVEQQERESRRIIDFLGLEWNDACLQFHTAKRVVRTLSYDQVRRPIYRAAVERHQHYERFLGPLKQALQG